MTDGSMKSRLHITNDLVTSSLSVTPVLWLSNGVKYVLPAVNLEPSGTATVDINQALADQGLAPYGTLSGYVEIDYQWPWDALCATVVNVDVAHSVIFNYGLQLGSPTTPAPQATAQASTQTLEGLWWKQEANVTGFVALTNPGSQAISASLVTSEGSGSPLGQNSVTVSPHGTKIVNLTSLPQTMDAAGGLRVVYNGSPNDLLVSGGLRDDATGYSANISFAQPPSGNSQASAVSAAAIGLMTGAPDPMLSFPAGTVFTPYAVIRNISGQPITFTPNLWWMTGGVAKNEALSQVSLAPYHALKLDVPSLLAVAGLKNYNGSVNLVLDIGANSPRGAVLFSTGSVDRNNTYVFQVIPGGVKESIAKNLSYWSTANGDDTMVTLWNPADEAQDFLFTLFYPGGHYKYPLHLEPRATSMFNVSEILHSAIPDADGNVIPVGVQEGSAELSGSQGEAQHILVSMDAGTYNVQKAICGTHCQACQGAVNSWVTDNPFVLATGATRQLTFTVQNHSGTQVNDTAPASWSSSNTSVATVSSGLVNGVAAGSLNANVVDDSYPLYGTECMPIGVAIECPINTGTSGDSPGNTFSGVLTPQDNFSGRSTSRFGIAEVINLSFNAQTTAAALGGLQWTIVSGGGSLSNAGTDGLGTYTAPGNQATVVLRLAVVSGASQGQHKDYTISIIPPNGGLESIFSNIRHTQGYESVGFEAHIFLEPTDVSFANLQFAEGTDTAIASGFFAANNGDVHPPTNPPVGIGPCNSVLGCQVHGQDTVDSGDSPPPFSVGDFLWQIPWQYKTSAGALTQFTSANHHETADATGRGTIEKRGAGPFAKNASDPTTTY